MIINRYMDPGWVCAAKKTEEDKIPDFSRILGIDCEMVKTPNDDNALARLTVIDMKGYVVSLSMCKIRS